MIFLMTKDDACFELQEYHLGEIINVYFILVLIPIRKLYALGINHPIISTRFLSE